MPTALRARHGGRRDGGGEAWQLERMYWPPHLRKLVSNLRRVDMVVAGLAPPTPPLFQVRLEGGIAGVLSIGA